MLLQGEDCHIHREAEQQVDFETFLQLRGRRDVASYVRGMHDLPCTTSHTFPLGYAFVYMLLADANNMT